MAESTFNERVGGSVCFFRYNYVEDHAMRYLMMIGIVTAICGCGPSEPSLSEVERGMKESFIRQTGNFAVRLTSHAKKIGVSRWSVWLTVEQNGGCRTLHATAVMDKNGDLHYYVD